MASRGFSLVNNRWHLTKHSYRDRYTDAEDVALNKISKPTKVFCLRCPKLSKPPLNKDQPLILEKISEGPVAMSNANFELIFNEDTRLLESITDKRSGLTRDVHVVFGAYPTQPFRNGAYLFKPDPNRLPPQFIPIMDPIDSLKEIVIISGPIFSEISLIYEAGASASNQVIMELVFARLFYTGQKNSSIL